MQQSPQLLKLSKPVFIALPYPETLDPVSTDKLTIGISLGHSNTEISLKWQASEMSALAELLKALATRSVSMKYGCLPSLYGYASRYRYCTCSSSQSLRLCETILCLFIL